MPAEPLPGSRARRVLEALREKPDTTNRDLAAQLDIPYGSLASMVSKLRADGHLPRPPHNARVERALKAVDARRQRAAVAAANPIAKAGGVPLALEGVKGLARDRLRTEAAKRGISEALLLGQVVAILHRDDLWAGFMDDGH